MEGFQYDAHPMGIFISTVGALSTLYRDAKLVFDQEARNRQCLRLIAKVASIAGYAYRHSIGRNYVYPDNDLSFTGNFLNMLFKMTELKYRPNPVLERALDVLFILHADHEQNCSTTAMRVDRQLARGSVFRDCGRRGRALGTAARRRERSRAAHAGGDRDESRTCRPSSRAIKGGDGRLMGFGHRVYKSYDPRAKIIKRIADEVFEVTGRNPLLDIALELERIALQDEYFVTRKLYPNVDFYSGLIYQAMGFPKDFFPVLFAIPRTAGWFAQWEEMLRDPEQKIARPRQIYVGPTEAGIRPEGEDDDVVRVPGFRVRGSRFALLIAVTGCGAQPQAQSPQPKAQSQLSFRLLPRLRTSAAGGQLRSSSGRIACHRTHARRTSSTSSKRWRFPSSGRRSWPGPLSARFRWST